MLTFIPIFSTYWIGSQKVFVEVCQFLQQRVESVPTSLCHPEKSNGQKKKKSIFKHILVNHKINKEKKNHQNKLIKNLRIYLIL